jgi:hypothetical protein
MKKRRRPYVYQVVDRYGKARYYFRRHGVCVRMPDDPRSAAFQRAYEHALAGFPLPAPKTRPKARSAPEREPPPQVGVYILLLDNKVVYIGTSDRMPLRVAEHWTNGRPFDQAFYIATRPGERRRLERDLIAALRPQQNRTNGVYREPKLANGKPLSAN